MPVLALIARVISSIHGEFCGCWKQKFFLKQRLKKSIGKKVLSVWNDSVIYNLWKEKAISRDIDAERSSSRSFMVKICILE